MRKFLLLATTALILVSISPRPSTAAPLISAIPGLVAALGPVGTTVAGIAASLGASWLFNALFAPETKQRGVKQDVENGAGLSPSFIFGTYATAGVMLYQNIWDHGDIPNQCMVMVIGLSALPVKGLQNQFYALDERVTINMSSNWNGGFKEVPEYINGASGGGYLLVKFHDGTQNTVDPWLLNVFGNHPDYPIHEDCAWRGWAYVIVQCWYSNRGIWSGWPAFKWVVEGIPLYDPRRDSTVPGGSGPQRWNDRDTWTLGEANAKVFEYNMIRGLKYGGDWQWGGDAEAYRLPLDYWFAAMNACDEDIALSGGGTVKRGHIGGEIHYDDDPREIVAEINKSVLGYTTLIGGQYKTWVGNTGLSVMTITDDDFIITAEREDELYRGQEQTYNTAYGYYPDARGKWEMKDSPAYVDNEALEEDGREWALDVQLPLVTHWQHCQRVLRGIVKDSRRQVTHRGQLPPVAYVLEPFDRITYISADNGYTGGGKAFRIDAKQDLPNVFQDTLIREINVDDVGWLPAYEMEDPVGPIKNIVGGAFTLPLVLTPDQIENTAGTKDRPSLVITWPWAAQDTDVRRIHWKFRRTGTTKKLGEGSFKRIADGSRTIVHPSLRFGREYEFTFLFESETPRKDEWGDWIGVTMVDPGVPRPTSLSASGQIGRIVLETTKSSNNNFGNWNLYVSNNNNFANAGDPIKQKGRIFTLDDLGYGVTRYFWITEEDRWGNEGPKFPASSTDGRTATTKRVRNGDLDDGVVEDRNIVGGEVKRRAIDDLAVDTGQIEKFAVSGVSTVNSPLAMVAHWPTTANPSGPLNWSNNNSDSTYGFDVVLARSGPIENSNPSPVTILGTMTLVQRCTDAGSLGDEKSEVRTKLVLEFSRNGGSWQAVPRFKGASCRDSARGSNDMKADMDKRSVNAVHKPTDTGTYKYRVRLVGTHRRGGGREWNQADILAGCTLSFLYMKR